MTLGTEGRLHFRFTRVYKIFDNLFMGCMCAFTKTGHVSLVPIKLNMCGDTKLCLIDIREQ